MVKQFTLNFKLSPDATYANYVGKAGLKVQESGDWHLVWGRPGTGKTHLLQAACHDIDQAIFLGELGKLDPQILHSLEHRPLVCLDDIDQIVGNREWEEALFHLMNGVRDHKGQLLVSTELPASQLKFSLADLQSRVLAATTTETDVLSDDQKLELLIRRARHWGFDLSDDVGRFILSRSPRNVVQLLDLLKRLELETLRQQKRVTIPFVKQTLQL